MLEPYRVWNRLPHSLQESIRQTPLFDAVHTLNERLWNSRWFVTLLYDFAMVNIECGDFHMELYVPTNGPELWREYEEHSCHEPLTTKTMVDHVDEGDVVWDIGSRLGYFSGVAAELNATPENVHMFELRVSNCRVIETMNEKCFDGRIRINNTRIGGPDAETSGDEYYVEHGAPDFIKMDIEGGEVSAIRGMAQLLEEHAPTMVVEGHPELLEKQGSSDDELLALLRRYYDDIRISFEFRAPDGEWLPVDEAWQDRFERTTLAEGEYDLYQLFCVR